MQSMLQLLLSRVQSGIGNTASVAHFSGRSIRDLQQIALRGSLLTVNDLVGRRTVSTHIIYTFPICSPRSQMPYTISMVQSTTENFLQVTHNNVFVALIAWSSSRKS